MLQRQRLAAWAEGVGVGCFRLGFCALQCGALESCEGNVGLRWHMFIHTASAGRAVLMGLASWQSEPGWSGLT